MFRFQFMMQCRHPYCDASSRAILATIYTQRNISHENIEYNQLFVTDITKYESTTR